jgi:hypothetical protein
MLDSAQNVRRLCLRLIRRNILVLFGSDSVEKGGKSEKKQRVEKRSFPR